MCSLRSTIAFLGSSLFFLVLVDLPKSDDHIACLRFMCVCMYVSLFSSSSSQVVGWLFACLLDFLFSPWVV